MIPLVLVICDGWGIRKERQANAIKLARTPNFSRFLKEYPHSKLLASGEAVGLPEGYQGNSEVGHMTLGSGRIIYQSLVRIDRSIKEGSFFKNNALLKAIGRGRRVHLMGLVQDEGVHSHNRHLAALIMLAKRRNVKELHIHAFTDGRDTPPKSAERYLSQIESVISEQGIGNISTLCGRYYAMDRDKRWVRTERAYQMLTAPKHVPRFNSWQEALRNSYLSGEKDEFITPRTMVGFEGIKEGDSVIFFNYRFDRARQLTKAFIESDFSEFPTLPLDLRFVSMTEYYKGMPCDQAFGPISIKNLLGEVISKAGLSQLRISETEKYAHVTFFFNGLLEKPFPKEDRILIESPKVATYDLKPDMSAYEQTEKLEQEIRKGKYSFIVQNLVNGDMVGHTGSIPAAIKAVEAVDECLGRIEKAVLDKKGIMIVTADHGNCEDMEGDMQTSHTRNPVNAIVISKNRYKIRDGELQDIAPTVLKILGLAIPKEMTGRSLLS